MPQTKTIKPVVIARTFFWLALAIATFALTGCSSCGSETPKDGGSPKGEASPTVGEPRSQPDRCHTTAPPLERRREIDRIIQKQRDTTPMERPAGSVTIQVYFHVLTNKEGTEGDVSEYVLREQIRVLNAAFSGTAPGGTGANTPFRFDYAGMETTKNDYWFNMTYDGVPTQHERDAKEELNQGDKSTLNVYTVRDAGGRLGWTRWPWDFADGVDGIVIRYSTLPGGSHYPYNEGDTLTHEVGHWLGLYHTFQGGCDPPGDSVADTWPEENPARDCPTSKDECEDDEFDPVRNFMNYTTDQCMYKFTRKQSDRMDATHLAYRT